MTSNPFSTVEATSEIVGRLQKAIKLTNVTLDAGRLGKIQEISQRLESLRDRGMLKRQEYSFPTSADIERRYLTGRGR